MSQLTPSDWLSLIGDVLGSLIGTLLAGLISVCLLKKEWKKNFILNNEELRKLLVVNKRSFLKLYGHSKFILAGKSDKNDEDLVIRDINNHAHIILQNFNVNKIPADLFNDFDYLLSLVRQIDAMAASKKLKRDGIKKEYQEIFNEKEFERFNESFKNQYEKIFKKLDLDIED